MNECTLHWMAGVKGAVDGGSKKIRQVRRSESGVPEEDADVLRNRRRDLHPEGRRGLHGEHGDNERGARRGLHGDVRSPGRAVREKPRPTKGRGRPSSELQHLQPDTITLSDDHKPLQDEREHSELQPRRNGVQRGDHWCGLGQGYSPGEP